MGHRVYGFYELRCSSAEFLHQFDVVAHGVKAILVYLWPDRIPIVVNWGQLLRYSDCGHVKSVAESGRPLIRVRHLRGPNNAQPRIFEMHAELRPVAGHSSRLGLNDNTHLRSLNCWLLHRPDRKRRNRVMLEKLFDKTAGK